MVSPDSNRVLLAGGCLNNYSGLLKLQGPGDQFAPTPDIWELDLVAMCWVQASSCTLSIAYLRLDHPCAHCQPLAPPDSKRAGEAASSGF